MPRFRHAIAYASPLSPTLFSLIIAIALSADAIIPFSLSLLPPRHYAIFIAYASCCQPLFSCHCCRHYQLADMPPLRCAAFIDISLSRRLFSPLIASADLRHYCCRFHCRHIFIFSR
jgi:hypothetical protein